MSANLEQTPAELKFLKGAKVTKITATGPDELGDAFLEITFEFPTTRQIKQPGVLVPKADGCVIQVWQDEEGNGPGYLAVTEAMELVPAKPAKK